MAVAIALEHAVAASLRYLSWHVAASARCARAPLVKRRECSMRPKAQVVLLAHFRTSRGEGAPPAPGENSASMAPRAAVPLRHKAEPVGSVRGMLMADGGALQRVAGCSKEPTLIVAYPSSSRFPVSLRCASPSCNLCRRNHRHESK